MLSFLYKKRKKTIYVNFCCNSLISKSISLIVSFNSSRTWPCSFSWSFRFYFWDSEVFTRSLNLSRRIENSFFKERDWVSSAVILDFSSRFSLDRVSIFSVWYFYFSNFFSDSANLSDFCNFFWFKILSVIIKLLNYCCIIV